jgi:predicted DCC family thiol-disulfide oxidoreductase YuxK
MERTSTTGSVDCDCRTVVPVRRPVLLYAGTCRFCRWAARLVTHLDVDQRLAVLPLTAGEVPCLLAGVPDAIRTETWWLVPRQGPPVSGRDGGALALLLELRCTRFVGRLGQALRLGMLLDALDRGLARSRGRLSRYVPDGPAPRRCP